ncbi:hypothetical protein [Clostridium cellulovorans]|uniref:Uncharacterized protein n=1 Tax=Clostridium cellulovorans (strain ATCC 35296 / DSM 3052 / OCM 3 / 743B) TaxID=573061 RepID=D9SKC9_CLOC7|nr:hypothetical protein [Clostridium cellulovorans]ADL51425.1 hypothetical protein Clocel_1681 [Clostridium cellulovorans 743B]
MKIKCINNDMCSSISIGKEYLVVEEGPEYFVILDDINNETTCKKSRFVVVEDGDMCKKVKATINELNYQLEHDNKDIKDFSIRKNSKGAIKEIIIKFNY